MAVGERHHAGVGPVGDVDVVAGEHGLDRTAQKRRIVAGHRRDDEELLLLAAGAHGALLEMDEPAEGALPDDALDDRDALAAEKRRGDAERGLAVAAGGALEELGRGGDAPPEGRVGERIERVAEIELGRVGGGTERADCRVVELEELVIRHNPDPFPARSGAFLS